MREIAQHYQTIASSNKGKRPLSLQDTELKLSRLEHMVSPMEDG